MIFSRKSAGAGFGCYEQGQAHRVCET